MMRKAMWSGVGVALIVLFVVGCSNPSPNGKQATAVEPAGSSQERKGRWVTLPPTTGSNVPRRVWVQDDGGVQGSPGDVQSTSAKFIEETQRRGMGSFQKTD